MQCKFRNEIKLNKIIAYSYASVQLKFLLENIE